MECNEFFISGKSLCEILQLAIEADKTLLIDLEWKNPILETQLILNYDPRKMDPRKKMLASHTNKISLPKDLGLIRKLLILLNSTPELFFCISAFFT